MRVSNPGCYPTGFLALIAPLVRGGLLPCRLALHGQRRQRLFGRRQGVDRTVRSRKTRRPFAPMATTWRTSICPKCRHMPGSTIRSCLRLRWCPAYRGMIVEVPLHLGAMANQPAVRSAAGRLSGILRWARNRHGPEGSHCRRTCCWHRSSGAIRRARTFVFGNEGGWNARLVAQLDNLGKGASGAAVQNLNLMCGLPQTTGLRLPRIASVIVCYARTMPD